MTLASMLAQDLRGECMVKMNEGLLEEEVGVALDEGFYVRLIRTLEMRLDQRKLASDEVLLVLKNELREVVDDFYHIASLDLVALPQQVEEANEVADLASQNTSTVRALIRRELSIF